MLDILKNEQVQGKLLFRYILDLPNALFGLIIFVLLMFFDNEDSDEGESFNDEHSSDGEPQQSSFKRLYHFRLKILN